MVKIYFLLSYKFNIKINTILQSSVIFVEYNFIIKIESTTFTSKKVLNIRRKYYFWKRKFYKSKERTFTLKSSKTKESNKSVKRRSIN